LETHLTGKSTEKRQNSDPSTPTACAEHLHFTLNGETRKTPGPPPDASAQRAWEDADHKVLTGRILTRVENCALLEQGIIKAKVMWFKKKNSFTYQNSKMQDANNTKC
jgi:hypothetical protein